MEESAGTVTGVATGMGTEGGGMVGAMVICGDAKGKPLVVDKANNPDVY